MNAAVALFTVAVLLATVSYGDSIFCPPPCTYKKDCSLPKPGGTCLIFPVLVRYRYNPTTRKCEEFKIGFGCCVNCNTFYTKAECEKSCI
ncbi:kappaPI-actitoxin-Avd3d-like [Amblyomma americanum]|uniref:BPTI/Kunitz inhibitor domain-containing protein n=1 Tax=Amblyomma americanum TaxID=6943 RepID=A0AAQ4DSH5_AMBAM